MTPAPPAGHLRFALLLRLLHREYAFAVESRLADAGFGDIRSGDAKVFPFVPPEGIPVGDLATRAGVRKQTMAQSVTELERTGYVVRRPNPHDGRSRLVFLTARGEAVRPVAATAGDAIEAEWTALTSPESFAATRAYLHDLLGKLAESDPSAAERLTSAHDAPDS